MMRWYEIHQSQVVRERLREAEQRRLAEEARRSRRSRARGDGDGERIVLGGRTLVAAALGGIVGWFAGR